MVWAVSWYGLSGLGCQLVLGYQLVLAEWFGLSCDFLLVGMQQSGAVDTADHGNFLL